MSNRINPEPWLTQHYVCEDCGATPHDRPVDCCDSCILKFYFDNPNASNFADWREPVKHEHTWGTDNLSDTYETICLVCQAVKED